MSTNDFRSGFDGEFSFMDEKEAFEDAPAQEKGSTGLFLGMTPVQRFVLVVMLFMMVCILGSFCLLVTNKISLPFF